MWLPNARFRSHVRCNDLILRVQILNARTLQGSAQPVRSLRHRGECRRLVTNEGGYARVYLSDRRRPGSREQHQQHRYIEWRRPKNDRLTLPDFVDAGRRPVSDLSAVENIRTRNESIPRSGTGEDLRRSRGAVGRSRRSAAARSRSLSDFEYMRAPAVHRPKL